MTITQYKKAIAKLLKAYTDKTPPAIWHAIYIRIFVNEYFFFVYIASDTAGFKCPPLTFPVSTRSPINVTPTNKTFPFVIKIDKTRRNVPKNSDSSGNNLIILLYTL